MRKKMNKNKEYAVSIYVIPSNKVAFTDYDELIHYVRRNRLSGIEIFRTRANSWNEENESEDITEQVWLHAYNNFDHYKDTNYPYEDRESIRVFKLMNMRIYD